MSAGAPRTLLIIAGIDPAAGAGLLADAHVAHDHGVRAVGAATALTVQDTRGVRAVHPTPPAALADALAVLLADVAVHAVKIGMLATAEHAGVVGHALSHVSVPVVWDPILAPTRGGVPLLEGDLDRAAAALLPRAALVTPNASEAARLTGLPVTTPDEALVAARALRARGAGAVLVKGGHLAGAPVDTLVDGDGVHTWSDARLVSGPVHGTGCVLSSAVASGLALGQPLRDAIVAARRYLRARLAAPQTVGGGARVLV